MKHEYVRGLVVAAENCGQSDGELIEVVQAYTMKIEGAPINAGTRILDEEFRKRRVRPEGR